MLYGTGNANWWGLWNLYNGTQTVNHKVFFDGATKTIWILDNITYVNVKEDLYSAWKEWVILYDFSKYQQAFETEGGKPISDTERLGDTYLLINNWKIRPVDGTDIITIDGNLYAYDMDGNPVPAYLPDANGKIAISSKVSNIVNTIVTKETVVVEVPVVQIVEVPAQVTPEQITAAVWDVLAASHTGAGTTGNFLNNLVNLDATISSRLPASSYVVPPTALENAETLLGLPVAGYNDPGTVGEKFNDIGTASITVDYTEVANAVWDARISDHNDGGTFGKRIRNISEDVVWSGLVVSSTTNTITLAADASSTPGAYDPAEIMVLEDGAGVGQCRLILEYDGATRTAVVDRNWKVLPSVGATVVITTSSGREHVNEGLARGGTINTITLNPNASDNDNAYIGQVLFIRSGYGEDQARRIVAYDGTTKIATLCDNWFHIPDTTSAYVMLPTAALDYGYIARGVLDRTATDFDTPGTIGEKISLGADGMTPAQEATLNLAHEEARRARALATNNVQITRTGTGVTQVDEIKVFDDDGVTELYIIKVYGDKAESRAVQYIKPY